MSMLHIKDFKVWDDYNISSILKKYSDIIKVGDFEIINVEEAVYIQQHSFVPALCKIQGISGIYDCYMMYLGDAYWSFLRFNGYGHVEAERVEKFSKIPLPRHNQDTLLLFTTDDLNLSLKVKLKN